MNVRVTQNAISRQYKNNMNSTLGQMNSINNKILTQRKFLRASENSVGAAKAISIRKNLANIETYSSNLDTAASIFTSAESGLKQISSRISDVTDSLISGVNGDKGQTEREIIANEIENVAKDMLKTLNADYADRKLFGGTNNSSQAFEYDSKTGKVLFNGTDINSNEALKGVDGNFYFGGEDVSEKVASGEITITTANTADYIETQDGKYFYKPNQITEDQANGNNSQRFEGTKSILIDIGIGIKFDDKGMIDPASALDISLNGAELTGNGVDGNGLSNNIIQLAFDAAQSLRSNDVGKSMELLDKIKSATSTLLVGITNLGVREQAIDFNKSKLDEDKFNLQAGQVKAEGMSEVDLAEAITQYKTIESAYNATLQMGAKVVPTSIFDFMK